VNRKTIAVIILGIIGITAFLSLIAWTIIASGILIYHPNQNEQPLPFKSYLYNFTVPVPETYSTNETIYADITESYDSYGGPQSVMNAITKLPASFQLTITTVWASNMELNVIYYQKISDNMFLKLGNVTLIVFPTVKVLG
jgi:hypothetical protein